MSRTTAEGEGNGPRHGWGRGNLLYHGNYANDGLSVISCMSVLRAQLVYAARGTAVLHQGCTILYISQIFIQLCLE
jgi:hypothetical protein